MIEILSEWITVKFESLQADGKWVQTFTAFMRYLKEESKRSDRSLESVQHVRFFPFYPPNGAI